MFDDLNWSFARAYARLGVRTYDLKPNASSKGRGLFLDPYPYPNADTAWDRLIYAAGEAVYEASVVVLRETARSQSNRVITPNEIRDFQNEALRSTGRRPEVYRLRFTGMRTKPVLLGSGGEDVGSAPLRTLRWLEMRAYLSWSGAVKRLDEGQFELPAGTLANAFIRVGDALTHYDVICSLSDWFDGTIASGCAVVCDTWTVLPLLQELRTRALAAGWDLPISSLVGYPSAAEVSSVVRDARALADRGADTHILFVLSVASSQKLLEKIATVGSEILGSGSRLKVDVLVLTTATADRDVHPDLQSDTAAWCMVGDVRQQKPDDQASHHRSAPVVRIDRARYYPLMEREVDVRFLSASFARKHAGLWEAAQRTSALAVHRYDTLKRRNMGVHFDVARLLDDPEFARSTKRTLRAKVPLCDLAIIPKHQATSALERLVHSTYADCKILTVSLDDEPPQFSADLETACAGIRDVLIVDDVIVQGRTVRRIHRLLQDQFTNIKSAVHSPHKDYEVWAFCVLSRPSSEGRWERLKSSLYQGGTRLHLEAAEFLLVPDEHDPFETEARDLETLLGLADKAEFWANLGVESALFEDAKHFVEERLQRLRGGSGLTDRLYPGRSSEWAEPNKISPHSLFGNDLSEVAAFAAVSTAMQEIRDEAIRNDAVLRWDVPRILTAYHDPLLASAFLRSALPAEMQLERVGRPFREALDELSTGTSLYGNLPTNDEKAGRGSPEHLTGNELHLASPILAGELLYAAVAERIPPGFRGEVWSRAEPLVRKFSRPWRDVQHALRSLYHG